MQCSLHIQDAFKKSLNSCVNSSCSCGIGDRLELSAHSRHVIYTTFPCPGASSDQNLGAKISTKPLGLALQAT